MEITIDRTYSELSFDSFLCGFYVFKDIWSPVIGEELNSKLEDENNHDRFTGANTCVIYFYGHQKSIDWMEKVIERVADLASRMKNKYLK